MRVRNAALKPMASGSRGLMGGEAGSGNVTSVSHKGSSFGIRAFSRSTKALVSPPFTPFAKPAW